MAQKKELPKTINTPYCIQCHQYVFTKRKLERLEYGRQKYQKDIKHRNKVKERCFNRYRYISALAKVSNTPSHPLLQQGKS